MVICQKRLPFTQWEDARLARLPGILPVEPGTWLDVDDAYGPQISHRGALVRDRQDAVHQLLPDGVLAAEELFDVLLDELRRMPEFSVDGDQVTCPDGRIVTMDRQHPLLSFHRVLQEDLCLMVQTKGSDEYRLMGALLCFPANWSLSQKLGHPLTHIHAPVEEYTSDLARRVNRLFAAIRTEAPLWRANALIYSNPELFQPTRLAPSDKTEIGYLRSERQVMRRLPQTGAVVFTIHTYVVPINELSPEQRKTISKVAALADTQVSPE
jgi:hypothetical protein